MRISDWSSDVCSSDLGPPPGDRADRTRRRLPPAALRRPGRGRSEERRVGKSVSVRVDLGGRRTITKKTLSQTHHFFFTILHLRQLHLFTFLFSIFFLILIILSS